MNHLSKAELLLLAEGELDGVRAAHAASCDACRVASQQAMGDLDAVTAVLSASAPVDCTEAKADSWVRLRSALKQSPKPQHVEIEDLLLHLDGETALAVSVHLEACSDCHDDLLRAQTLLFDVEHELRALIPEESERERLTSAVRLEKALDARRSRVLSFPAPWRAVYAAAALVAAGLFGFAWYAQEPAQLPPPTVASAPAPVAPPLAFAEAGSPRAIKVSQEIASDPVIAPASGEQLSGIAVVAAIEPARSTPDRFDGVQAVDSPTPQPAALAVEPAPLVALAVIPVRFEATNLPEIGRPVLERTQPVFTNEPTRVVVADPPAGGVVRSALLEHYGDAARRSFRSARPDQLEGELARYVSDVLHAESELLRHAYSLHEMIKGVDLERLDEPSRRRLRVAAHKSLSTIREQEEQLYIKLSEALPRNFWATKGRREDQGEGLNLETRSAALLEAALKLDKNLSAVFVDADSSVNFEPESASLGDLLYIVRSSSRNLQERLSVLH